MADEAYRAVFLRVHPTGKMVLSLTTESDGKEAQYAQLVADELGIPALYVPLPGTRGDEQTENARIVERVGGAVVLPIGVRISGLDDSKLPVVVFGDGTSLVQPTSSDLATKLGMPRQAQQKFYDVVVVGAGPAGLAAGVYAALPLKASAGCSFRSSGSS